MFADGLDEAIIEFLGDTIQHHMVKVDHPLSMVNVVGKINETVTAESDPRAAGSKASIF